MKQSSLKSRPLIDSEKEFLSVVKKLTKKGIPPTIEEIAEKMTIAKSTAAAIRARMIEMGYATAKKGKSRSLSLTNKN
jgi:Mn-dependent DtxR family transcriptional regulator